MLARTSAESTPGRAAAADVLTPGLATGIGSLPHRDPSAAARLVLRMTPELPAAPQLPMRSPHEDMISQWLRALPEVDVDPTGAPQLEQPLTVDAQIDTEMHADAHAGFFALLDVTGAATTPPRRVKVQVTGPLTLGLALQSLGADALPAFRRAAELVITSSQSMVKQIEARFGEIPVVVFCDEPSLSAWRDGEGPIHRDDAVDLLSATLVRMPSLTGVHVCTGGDVSIACGAGPDIVGVDVSDPLVEDALALGRHLEGGGWIAWGAVPTHRPVGDSAEPLWRRLVEQWCELTRRGCDPHALRQHALLTPACGLAGHGLTQAERALRLAGEIGRRVGDQAAATKLTIGA